MEATVKYGLRHLASGRFVRLSATPNIGEDFCGEETCVLEVGEWSLGQPRFEVGTLYDLIAAMSHDTEWYNSSRDRPGWGKVSIEECAPCAFVRTAEMDGLGGDPVSVTERAVRLRIPELYSGEAYNTRQPNAQELRGLFGLDEDLPEEAWPFVTLAKPGGASLETGMLIDNRFCGKGIVVATAGVPDRWPFDPGRPVRRGDEGLLLVLARSDALRVENELPAQFADTSEPDETASPAP